MGIFGYLEVEPVVQVNDRTRLSAAKSFISKDSAPVSLVRIEPEAGAGFITVSGPILSAKDWFIDWQYSTPGIKQVSLEITTDGAPQVFTKEIEILTAAQDMLWSSDSDLVAQENDILNWTPPGRNSFLNIHRAAQKRILDWLAGIRVFKRDGTKLEKADMLASDDLNMLSTYWALQLIFEAISNKPDDVFAQKARDYRAKVNDLKNAGRIQADFNGNGTLDKTDNNDMRSFRMVRR
jgi:hypothetical protein